MLKNFKTFQMALSFYRKTKSLNLKGEIKDQLERASLSIMLNLAEGSGKESLKDRRRFYSISFCSIREVQAIMLIIDNEALIKEIDLIAAACFKLVESIKR